MPAVPAPRPSFDQSHEAFAESNSLAVIISKEHGNPRKFIVRAERNHFEIWIYIWSLTHGGGCSQTEE